LAAEEKKQYNNNNNRALSTPQHLLSSVERPLKSSDVADETPFSKHLIGVKEDNGGSHNSFPTQPKEMNGGPHNNFHPPIIQKEREGSGFARAKSDAEIMGEFREVYNRLSPLVPFRPTKPHQRAAIDFYQRSGQAVALAAWACFLVKDDPEIMSKGKKEARAHRLNDFCSTGACETYAKQIKDWTPDELQFIAQQAAMIFDDSKYRLYLKQNTSGNVHGFVRHLMSEEQAAGVSF
jgi:hypothetical protein